MARPPHQSEQEEHRLDQGLPPDPVESPAAEVAAEPVSEGPPPAPEQCGLAGGAVAPWRCLSDFGAHPGNRRYLAQVCREPP